MDQATPDAPVSAGDHLILVDGSAFIFRAFHALPPLTRKSDGLPVGAVHGFCNMIWKLLQDGPTPEPGDEPTHFGVVFDYSAKTFRNDIFGDYKANRSAPPAELIPQFGLIREATRAFNLACIEQEGYEADDLIATYAVQAADAGAQVSIVSADKDLMQLVGPRIVMIDTMRDQRIDEAHVREKFGVAPDKMIDLQALTGDSTDNVPGVPGIGPKTAAQLLDEFGDLDAILARAGEIRQVKRRENLIAFADQARMSRRLVTLDCAVPLAVSLDALRVEALDGAKAIAFCKAMGFNSLTRRVAEATGTDAAEIEPATVPVQGWPQGEGDAHGPDMPPAAGDGVQDRQGGEAPPAAAARANALGTPQELTARRAQAAPALPIDVKAYGCIRTIDELDRWIGEAFAQGLVAIDTETTSLDPMQAELCGVSLALAPGRACYVPLGHRPPEAPDGDLFSAPPAPSPRRAVADAVSDPRAGNGGAPGAADEGNGSADDRQIPLGEALARLKPLLEDASVLKIGQNLKYDWLVLARHGVEVAPFDDTMLISYVLDAGRSPHGMDALAQQWLGHTPISYKDVAGSGRAKVTFDRVPIDRATEYAAEDADVTLRLWSVLKPRLAAENVSRVYERLERPMIPVLARMERRGIRVDRQILSRLSGDFAQAAAALEAEIYELAGGAFNIGSTKQLGDILFGRMKLPGGRKTPSGAWSTDFKALEDLAAEGYELPKRIVAWRQLTKLKSTYTDALPTFIHPETGRVHTGFSLASTSTGRLSSSDPNLQNIPIRTDEGRAIRTAFVADEGTKLVSADYSQIELRLLAHMADIPQLVRAFTDGLDIHALTASEMFGVPLEGMDPAIRRRAKMINFGIIYGISSFGLAARLGIGREEAGDYIRTYFKRFPGIRDYIEDTKRTARERGYVETLFGRRVWFPNITTGNPSVRAGVERAAINAPIQGTAADIIRRAMIRMDDALAEARLAARMLLQVHDELIFEVPEEEVEATIPVVSAVMERAPEPAVRLGVPLQVEARAADDWEAAH